MLKEYSRISDAPKIAKPTTCVAVPRKAAKVTNNESPAIERSAAAKCVALLKGSFEKGVLDIG